ncbi:MAG: UDP-N-acetylmuramate--L-alanine ligase, partial [Bacteroidia bacterium]
GKTTTTTIMTHILKVAGINCFAFMGGISNNYHSNLLLGNANKESWFIVEADEFDRSFLHLKPFYSIITSCDADHLDIYGNKNEVKEGFSLFAKNNNKEGKLIVNKNVDNDLSLPSNKEVYSLNLSTDYVVENVHFKNFKAQFDFIGPDFSIHAIEFGVSGWHNVENAMAAIAVAKKIGISDENIKDALRSFKGVKRRFDVRINSGKTVFIDDYAHHPEELRAIISSVRKEIPNRKICGVFQPHLYSRTRDFAKEFAQSLEMLDEILLLDIYPAREEPIEGINSNLLINLMNSARNAKVVTKDELLNLVRKESFEVILTMGAGDIDRLIEPIEEILRNK